MLKGGEGLEGPCSPSAPRRGFTVCLLIYKLGGCVAGLSASARGWHIGVASCLNAPVQSPCCRLGPAPLSPVVHVPEELQVGLVHHVPDLLPVALHQLCVAHQLLLGPGGQGRAGCAEGSHRPPWAQRGHGGQSSPCPTPSGGRKKGGGGRTGVGGGLPPPRNRLRCHRRGVAHGDGVRRVRRCFTPPPSSSRPAGRGRKAQGPPARRDGGPRPLPG